MHVLTHCNYLDEYDLAGFAVGAVERENLLPHISDIKANSTLIGLASSRIHSNGFSLIQKIIAKKKNLNYETINMPMKSQNVIG